MDRLRAVAVRVAGDLLAAVPTFVGACWAMLQSSFARDNRVLSVFSVLRFQASFGSRIEFVATTLAIAWLVVFGAVLSARLARPSAVPEPSVA